MVRVEIAWPTTSVRILKGARAGGQFAASNLTGAGGKPLPFDDSVNLGLGAQYRGLLFWSCLLRRFYRFKGSVARGPILIRPVG
jgi:hypothetical protein